MTFCENTSLSAPGSLIRWGRHRQYSGGFFFLFYILNPQYDAAIHHIPRACFQLAVGPPPCLGLPLWHQGGEHSAGKRVGVHVAPWRKDSSNNPTSLGLRKVWELWRCSNSNDQLQTTFFWMQFCLWGFCGVFPPKITIIKLLVITFLV